MGYNLTKRNPLYELIADYTVTGSAITSYTFSNLNLIKDEDYVLVSNIINNSGTNVPYYYAVNGNTTLTNYYYESLEVDGTTVSGGRNNSSFYDYVNTGHSSFNVSRIKLTNSGYFVYQNYINRFLANSTYFRLLQAYGTSTFTMSSITSLTVMAQSGYSALSVGTRFQLYRIRPASKIADVTIGSAVTSYTFDLSATPIGKGSEFMLVSDIVGNRYYSAFANTNYTTTDYYTQRLYALSTTVGSQRSNSNWICTGPSFTITNLKLTNNGYFVCQSYESQTYGGSGITLVNSYVTSTFTTSSVNSLRISADNANGIGIGSRFQLYKLK